MEALRAADMAGVFALIAEGMHENRDYLIELDGNTGDGDLGLTMTQGFDKVNEVVKENEETDIGKILMKAGMAMAQEVPSTMGTLMATGMMRGGKAVAGSRQMDLSDFAKMLNGFVTGVMDRGKAKPGEKTLLDSLHPALCALRDTRAETLEDGLKIALEAAKGGVEDTRNMEPVHGRAIYHREKSIGAPDQGAVVGMLFLKGFCDYVHTMSGM